MTAPASVYPRTVEQLLPDARTLAGELGEVPSRNRLMREFRIGAPKADEVRDALIAEQVRQLEERTADEPAPDPWEHAVSAGSEPGLDDLEPPIVEQPETNASEPVTAPPAAVPVPARTWVSPPPHAAPTASGPAAHPVRSPLVAVDGHPGTTTAPRPARRAVVWPVVLLALPAFVSIWSGWVGLGGLTGFGVVHPLPGIADGVSLDTAITLPIGVETYGAYALYIWLSGRVPDRARTFAKWSAIASLLVGAGGQVAYHLLVAPPTGAPWWITTAVSVLPVAVLGMGAALAHLVREDRKA